MREGAAATVNLLDLQAEDTAIARLTHRRNSLPEAQRLARLRDRLFELEGDLEIAKKHLDEVMREQNRLEGEIGVLEQKTAREEQRLFSGSVANPKELSALQAEVAMLKRKRTGLEDSLLEVMVQRDEAKETVDSLSSEHSDVEREAGQLGDVVSELNKEIEAELETRGARRREVADTIASDLLGLYEKVRDAKGGVGAAALENGTCQGCHTKLPAREVERLRSEGGIQRCENCRRILVIT